MNDRFINIVSFDVPYPADYGGVIDVFYKIKSLNELGIKVILHCFYNNREENIELDKICYKVFYYKRKMSFYRHLSIKPYITISRKSKCLLQNLLSNDFPILFEGVHSCYYFNDIRLHNRLKILRAHNVENEYYANLAHNETKLWKKYYYKLEAYKLKLYENNLNKVDIILSVNDADVNYFQKKHSNVHNIPTFHQSNEIDIKLGNGDYILYHGNLSVNENIFAVSYLIENVFSKINYPIIIAGKNPVIPLKKLIKNYSHIRLLENVSSDEMTDLIQNAHINVLITFQPTGLKLKLLHALSIGRFCLVNPSMLHGLDIDKICHIADTVPEIIFEIENLLNKTFDKIELSNRENIFIKKFSNINNAKKIISLVFNK